MTAIPNWLQLMITKRWVMHGLFWLLINAIFAYTGSLFGGTFWTNFINLVALLPIQMLVTYLLVYVQMPSLLFRKKYFLFLISLLLISFLAAVLARLCILYIAEPILFNDPAEESLGQIIGDPVYLYKVYVVSLYLPAVIFFLIKMTKERFIQQRDLEVLQKEKNAAELNFLKAQMNPHFLFNTLNNLYALAETNDQQTPEMILKLSEILNYTIYECTADKVPIRREWELIEHYADLEALRFNNRIEVRLISDIDNPDALIAPLLLISIVENAFKFGLKGNVGEGRIDVTLRLKEQQLEFHVANSYATENEKEIKPVKNGIGNQNLIKQLSLLYPGRHELKQSDTGDFYNVHLNIQL